MSAVYLGPYYYQTSHPRPLELPAGEWERRVRGRARRRAKLLKLLLFTMFAIYPTESSRILNMYICRDVEGTAYLVQDFNVKCYDSKWNSFVTPVRALSLAAWLCWFSSSCVCVVSAELDYADHLPDRHPTFLRLSAVQPSLHFE